MSALRAAALIGVLAVPIGGLLVTTAVAARRGSSDLVTTGPYVLTRNPIYVGLAFVYFGIAAALRLTWALLLLPVVIAAVDQVVVAREERRLLALFGDEYRHYIAATPRWLLAKWRAS